jgi:hypothetical protein
MHDVRCGFNGFPAGPGWDQATGFGSPNWFQMAQGMAGQPVSTPPQSPDVNDCQAVTAPLQLLLPVSNWPPGTILSQSGNSLLFPDKYADSPCTSSSCYNAVRQYHKTTYASHGYINGLVDEADVQIGGDKTPYGEWLGSYYGSNVEAAAVVTDVVDFFAGVSLGDTSCSSLTPDCHQYLLIYRNSQSKATYYVDYYIYAIGNTVGEAYLGALPATATAQPGTFGADGLWIAVAGMDQLRKATDSPSDDAAGPLVAPLSPSRGRASLGKQPRRVAPPAGLWRSGSTLSAMDARLSYVVSSGGLGH